MLSKACLVDTEAQTWLHSTGEPAVSLRFGWHHIFKEVFPVRYWNAIFICCCLQCQCCLMKMLLLLNLAGWRAAKEQRKCRREHHADKGQRDKHCAVVASGPAYRTFVSFLNSLWGSGKRTFPPVLHSGLEEGSFPLRIGKYLLKSSDALQWVHGSVQGICIAQE